MMTSPADFRIELGYLRDNLLAAIYGKKTSLLQEGLEMYENLLSSFIDKLQQWGSPYDKKRAMQEATSIGGDWSEIKWINDDLRELIDAGIAVESVHIIKQLFLLLYKLARNALTGRDYYIFYRSVTWFPYLYQASTSVRDEVVKTYVAEHSCLGLKEIGDLFVFPQIESAQSLEDLDRIHDFGVGIVITFSQLLKSAYSKSDNAHFTAFAQMLMQLFSNPRIEQQSADRFATLTVTRLNPHLSAQEVARIDNEANLVRRRIAIVRDLEERKALALFGFGALFLRDYEANKLAAEGFDQYYGSLPKMFTLEEAWRLYVRATDEEVKQDFGWEWWDMSGGTHGFGLWGGIDQDLQLNFLVRSLEVIKDIPEPNRATTQMPGSSDLLALAQSEDSPFNQLLVQLQQDGERWLPILGQPTLDAIPALREILSRAALGEKQRQAEVLINAKLSAEKIDQVKRNILKGWSKNALIRELVRESGAFASGGAAPDGAPFFGINRRDRKDIYVEGPGYFVEHWGEQYGEGIGRGEDELVLDKLVKGALLLNPDPINETQIFEYLDNGIAGLRRAGYQPAILALNIWQIETLLEQRIGFARPRGTERAFWRLGEYQGSSVYHFRFEGPSQLLGVDLKKIGKWLQFRPRRTADDEVVLQDNFLFSIRPITHEQAFDLLAHFRQLRQRQDRSDQEILRELQQQVHLRVVEQFDYQITDPKAAFALRFG